MSVIGSSIFSRRVPAEEGFSLRKVSLSIGSRIRKDSRDFRAKAFPNETPEELRDEKASVLSDKTAEMNSLNVI